LVSAGYPSRWQPWSPGDVKAESTPWTIRESDESFSARCENGSSDQWLRYYHNVAFPNEWKAAAEGRSLANVNPRRSRAITDFYAYNSGLFVPSRYVYSRPPGSSALEQRSPLGNVIKKISSIFVSDATFDPAYRSADLDQFGRVLEMVPRQSFNAITDTTGNHWVGDLLLESTVDVSEGCESLQFEIVEAGVKYRCELDFANQTATMKILDAIDGRLEALPFSSGKTSVTAKIDWKAGSTESIRMTNADDRIQFWIGGEELTFEGGTEFDSRNFRDGLSDRPYYSESDPLDAAPVGIAASGSVEIEHLKLMRDKYYIATKLCEGSQVQDYDFTGFAAQSGIPNPPLREIRTVLISPQMWDIFPAWETRRTVSFDLRDDQFFPMGDNSPGSLDARCWTGKLSRVGLPEDIAQTARRWNQDSFVRRELLVGRAVSVIWPHSWNRPVPFTPNVKQMKAIR
ncbi:MAG: signal peptidase I, partial [Planctomycetota bacterium]